MSVSIQNIINAEHDEQPYAFLVKKKGVYEVYARKLERTYKVCFINTDLSGRQSLIKLEDFKSAQCALLNFANRFRHNIYGEFPRMQVFINLNILTVYQKANDKYVVVKLKAMGECDVLSEILPTYQEALDKLNQVSLQTKCSIIGNLLCKCLKVEFSPLPNYRAL